MKTINLKGKAYAPVSARVEQFHKDHDKGSIVTETTFTDGYVIVKATVSFSTVSGDKERTFTGHSYGTVKGEKAFEKLETTAVGRALAFAGYLAGGEIASYDEMQDFVADDAAIQDACGKLSEASTLAELKEVWDSLPATIKKDNEVEALKNEVKTKLS